MNFLLVPLAVATIFLFIKRDKSPRYKTLFVLLGTITLVLGVIAILLAVGLRDIKD